MSIRFASVLSAAAMATAVILGSGSSARAARPSPTTPQYHVVNVIGGMWSKEIDLSDTGLLVGSAGCSDITGEKAMYWDSASATTSVTGQLLPEPAGGGSVNTAACGVGAQGLTIAGFYYAGTCSPGIQGNRPMAWSYAGAWVAETMEPCDPDVDARATDANDYGLAVGWCSYLPERWVRDATTSYDWSRHALPMGSGFGNGRALGVNENGLTCGWQSIPPGPTQATAWRCDTDCHPVLLPNPHSAYGSSSGRRIAENGDIAGKVTMADGTHAAVWHYVGDDTWQLEVVATSSNGAYGVAQLATMRAAVGSPGGNPDFAMRWKSSAPGVPWTAERLQDLDDDSTLDHNGAFVINSNGAIFTWSTKHLGGPKSSNTESRKSILVPLP